MKKMLVFLSLFLVLGSILFLAFFGETKKVCFGGNCFRVELAQTEAERNKGLMFRDKLGPDRGMLFIFEQEGLYPFWMKNTLIPLDMIWINQNKEVVFIVENVQPCVQDFCPSINPDINASYVLELNAGTANKIGLKVGDTLTMNY
ncbi:MAG: DUF192 domain-containing protein [Candidatus Pacebacteria bacterium]|nr:DUF192 domain-containing protein [Candidatus Paceibacterota bacterium]